ncbi:hypothetical protein ZWY2020_009335 [Hordeum vulgare]|nr:hypothetical protein ZWY2020_009335 [Hordeum vulgare]
MDYPCSQVGVDCGAIQPGGACFEPNTVHAHAAYAMNQLYLAADSHPWNCDFRQSATLTSTNPRKPPILPWHLPSPLLTGPCITYRAAELVLCDASARTGASIWHCAARMCIGP